VALCEYPVGGGEPLNTVPLNPYLTLPVGGAAAGFLGLSPDGRFLTLAANGQTQVTVVRINGAGKVEEMATAPKTGPSGAPSAAAFVDGEEVCYLGGGQRGPVPGLRMVSLRKDGPVPSAIANGSVGQVAAVADRTGRAFLVYESPMRLFAAGALPLHGDPAAEFPLGRGFALGSSGFALLDRDPATGATGLGGLDTLYLASDTNLLKFEWSVDGWVPRGSAGYTNFHAVAARERNGQVEIFATVKGADGDQLVKVLDDGAFGSSWNRLPRDFVTLATSGPAEFRGVTFSPENLDLEELSIEEGKLEPGFDGEHGKYQALLGSEVVSVTARAAAPSAGVEVRVNGGEFANVNEVSLPLLPGKNTVEVRVRSTVSGASRFYTLEVVRVVPPELGPPAPPKISGTFATLNGEILRDGGTTVTERGVVWAPARSAGELAETGVRSVAQGTSEVGPFAVELKGLEAGETYVFRAYARNGAGVRRRF
jgi:hypothetical protein